MAAAAYRCKTAFAYWVDGVPQRYSADKVYVLDDKDRALQGGRAKYFERIDDVVAAEVEKATKAPGEKRTTTTRKRKTASSG